MEAEHKYHARLDSFPQMVKHAVSIDCKSHSSTNSEERELRAHFNVGTPFHPNNFPCTKCSDHFPTHTEQSSHLQTVHDVINSWLCLRCPHASATKALHDQHMSKKHNGPKTHYSCPRHRVSKLATPTKEMMDRHLRYDRGSKSGCPTCDFTNETRLGVSMHILHEHAHRCAECGEGFDREAKLSWHLYKQHTQQAEAEAEEAQQALSVRHSTEDAGGDVAKAFVAGLPPEAMDAIIEIEAMKAETTRTKIDSLAGLPTPAATATPEPSSPPKQQNPHRPTPPTPMQTPATSQPKSNFSITHMRHDFTASDFNPRTTYLSRNTCTPANYRPCPPSIPNSLLFDADPKILAYGNLLRLNETHTHAQIMALANAGGRPEAVFRNRAALERRMTSAYRWAVGQVLAREGRVVSVGWVKAETKRRRAANGVVGV